MTIIQRQVHRIPLHIYSGSAKVYTDRDLYVVSPKSETGTWYELMFKAQNSGRRLATSAEWFLARRHLEERNQEAERDFIEDTQELTGTVLDSENGHLLEDIQLNPDGSIKTATRLGEKEGIVFPEKSSYVKDLADRYMPLASHLWGVQDPKRELPDYAYLGISPGFRPVVRGGIHGNWIPPDHDILRPPDHGGRRVTVAGCNADDWDFATRFVSDARPDNLITPAEHEALAKRVVEKEAELRARMKAELKPLQDERDVAVVLVEY